jgi:hypothetical protein
MYIGFDILRGSVVFRLLVCQPIYLPLFDRLLLHFPPVPHLMVFVPQKKGSRRLQRCELENEDRLGVEAAVKLRAFKRPTC